MSELKPCPFCGGEAHLSDMNEYGEYLVECVNDFCNVMPSTFPFRTEDAAIEAWNRRVKDE